MRTRWLPIWVALALLVPVVAVAAPSVYDQVWGDQVEARLDALEAEVFPTTTTTVPPLAALGATQPYPGPFGAGAGFRISANCDATSGTPDPADDVDCGVGGTRFEYSAHGMPYPYPEAVEGNHDHAWWVAGDRESYKCAYAFMYDKHPDPNGDGSVVHPNAQFIARATVVRPINAGYGTVGDKYMAEGVRYYNGDPANEGNEINSENCQTTSLDPAFDYDSYVPQGDQEIRVGLFRADGALADIRDFTEATHPGAHFEFIGLQTGGPGGTVMRVSLVRIIDGGVSHAIYYDTLTTGRVVVEVGGQIVAEG